jgi:uncharacterized protein (DUF1684 family)
VEWTFGAADALDLLDWKVRVLDLYGEIRATEDPEAAWRRWRAVRDELFASHPQSPLPEDERDGYGGSYFDYDPDYRVHAEVLDVEPEPREVAGSAGRTFPFARIGLARFGLAGEPRELELAWNEGYGGGLFLCFRDATSGRETYGGGRYLLDTVKGADLGRAREKLVLDFNFAYNPSCCYDPRWACPLAPPANVLPLDVRAGERIPEQRTS